VGLDTGDIPLPSSVFLWETPAGALRYILFSLNFCELEVEISDSRIMKRMAYVYMRM